MASYIFDAKLLNSPTVTEQLSGGRLDGKEVSLELSNASGTFTIDRDSGQLAIGNYVRLDHYLPDDTVTSVRNYLYGKITAIDIPGEVATITVTVEDPAIFSQQWPTKVYGNGDWALQTDGAPYDVNGTTKINPSTDLGRVYPVLFGYAPKVKAVYVYADYDNDKYYYIICRGQIEANNGYRGTKINVYRNTRLVSTDEYTVYDGSQTSIFPGYAFVVFDKEQSDGSNLYEITVDAYGLLMGESTAQRNPAKIIEWILNDSTVGLGESVDTTSFDSAATTLSTLGGGSKAIYIDGAIDEQLSVQDLIDHLAEECARSYIYRDSSDNWCIATDTYQSTSLATFGQGDDNYRNILSINSYTSIDRVKSVTVKYGYDNWSSEYKFSYTRNVLSGGEELEYEYPLIQDHETADIICCYLQRRLLLGNYEVDLDLGMEARDLVLFQPITILQQWKSPVDRSIVTNINGQFQVRKIERGLYQWSIIGYTNSAGIYNYYADTLNTDPADDGLVDYSFTPPSAPTGLDIGTSGVRQGTDGGTYAYYTLYCTAPTTNCKYIEFGWKEKNATNYQFTIGTKSGSTWYGTVEGLIPGQLYYFAARGVNPINAEGYTQGELAELISGGSGYTAPGDTTPPGTITAGTATVKIKTWNFTWTKSSAADIKDYHVQISTSSGFGTTVYDGYVGADYKEFTYNAAAYGSLLYARVKGRDFTGNESASWSSTMSIACSQIVDGDITDLTITGAKIANATITSGKIDSLSANSISAGTLTITSTMGITIQSGGNLTIQSGGDIELQGTTSLTNYIIWKMTSGSSYYMYEGAYYNTGYGHMIYRSYPGVTKTQYYCIGNGYSYHFYGIELDCAQFELNCWGATSASYSKVSFTYANNSLYPSANTGATLPSLGLTTNPWTELVLAVNTNYWRLHRYSGTNALRLDYNSTDRFAFGIDGSLFCYYGGSWIQFYPVSGSPSAGQMVKWNAGGYAYWSA